MDKLKVEYRNPNDLIPYALNAKLHPADQVNRIASSIAEFGFDQPIVIDKKGIIIKGHGRCQAAIKLKLESVPVVVADLSDAMAKASRLADNKVSESDWDNELLKSSIDSLLESVGGSEIDLNAFGFDVSGFDDLIESESFDREYEGNYQGEGKFDEEIEDSEADEPPQSTVRMMQLFLNTETHPLFIKMIEELNNIYETDNSTDCVMAALREVCKDHSIDL
jgi:hypothetical protein